MFKKIAFLAVILIAAVLGIRAAVSYNAYLINNPALAYTSTYTLNLATTPQGGGITHLSAQAILSTATVASSSFTDGRVSTGSVTVANTSALLAASATNQITIAATATVLAAGATNYLVVLTTSALSASSATVTYNGNPLRVNHEWFVASTTSGTAANIATAINKFYGIAATRTNSEVDLIASPAGAVTNNRTLKVNTSSITVGGATFGGGHNNRLATSVLTVNGIAYPAGYNWIVADTSSGTATSIAFLLNHIAGLKASASGTVVYSTATASGTAGNAFTLVSSQPSYMTATAATYSGGRSNANVCINLTCVTQGTDWTAVATASGTAKAISDAITANATLHQLVNSTWTAAGVVNTTTTVTGAATNYVFSTNVPSYLTLSHATLVGGQTSAFIGGTSPITIPAHGYGTGLGVIYSTGTGNVTISPLVNGATYYVAVIDANHIALSTTSAAAIAGNYIVLGTQSTVGPHTFNLVPNLVTGTPGLAWQSSSDCTNWSNMNVSSVTFASPYVASTTSWDFGTVSFKCIRAVFTGPSTGAVNIQVPISGN